MNFYDKRIQQYKKKINKKNYENVIEHQIVVEHTRFVSQCVRVCPLNKTTRKRHYS